MNIDPERTELWEERLAAVSDVLPYLEDALHRLRESYDSDEADLLEEVIVSLRREEVRLESRLDGIWED